MEPEKMKERIESARKAGWIEAWMAFDVVAVSREVAENAMKNHIEKISKAKDTIVFDTSFRDCTKVERVPRHLQNKIKPGTELWSQVSETRALFRNLFTLLNIVMVYGPSAIEIHSPREYRVKTDEMQNIANVVAGLLHEFAGAGAGGLLVSGERE